MISYRLLTKRRIVMSFLVAVWGEALEEYPEEVRVGFMLPDSISASVVPNVPGTIPALVGLMD